MRRACPAGVFNLVQGDGPTVGAALSSHPEVDMGLLHRLHPRRHRGRQGGGPRPSSAWRQELGGKSPNIVLDDDAFAKGVGRGVATMMTNSGQSCNAPTRMLVPAKRMDEAIAVARETAAGVTVGDPNGNSQLGPVVNKTQFDKIQKLIQAGIDEGATLVIGGVGPAGRPGQGLLRKAHGVRQREQRDDHRKEEIFGPVLSILRATTPSSRPSISATTPSTAWRLTLRRPTSSRPARWRRSCAAGQVSINGGGGDLTAPFGRRYKMSGRRGASGADYAFHEFLETKAVLGYAPKQAAE